MTTNQIYGIVNSTVEQSMGTKELTAVDERGLVSTGDAVLSSSNNTEAFMNTLVQRIGKVVLSSRNYTSKHRDMVLDGFTFGAIVQKIDAEMPDFEESKAYDLEDGKSVDQQIVRKPKVKQKLFVTRTPYMLTITVQRHTLKEAFLSEANMGAFISMIFQKIENKLELRIDVLGRNCLANYIAESKDMVTHYKLLTLYEAETGITLTKAEAVLDEAFLRWVVGFISDKSEYLTEYSETYNIEKFARFTPKADQRLKILTSFDTKLATQMQYGAYNDGYVKLEGYQRVNHFQAALLPDAVKVTPATGTAEVTVNNIVAVMYDRDALGIYNRDEEVSTSPYNSVGRYQNTNYHFMEMYFNDLSENFLLFTLD